MYNVYMFKNIHRKNISNLVNSFNIKDIEFLLKEIKGNYTWYNKSKNKT